MNGALVFDMEVVDGVAAFEGCGLGTETRNSILSWNVPIICGSRIASMDKVGMIVKITPVSSDMSGWEVDKGVDEGPCRFMFVGSRESYVSEGRIMTENIITADGIDGRSPVIKYIDENDRWWLCSSGDRAEIWGNADYFTHPMKAIDKSNAYEEYQRIEQCMELVRN